MKDEFGIKYFEDIVDAIWDKREVMKNEDFYFDYPDYAGISKRIAGKLSSDVVDIIQERCNPFAMREMKRKTSLRNELKECFFLLGDQNR